LLSLCCDGCLGRARSVDHGGMSVAGEIDSASVDSCASIVQPLPQLPDKHDRVNSSEDSGGSKVSNQRRKLFDVPNGEEILELHQKVNSLSPRVDNSWKVPLRRQRKEFATVDLSDLEHIYSEISRVKAQAAAAETVKVKVSEGDLDYEHIQRLEAELNWYVAQAVRLLQISRNYCSEAEHWREQARTLTEELQLLTVEVHKVRYGTELAEAAQEKLHPLFNDLSVPVFSRHKACRADNSEPMQHAMSSAPLAGKATLLLSSTSARSARSSSSSAAAKLSARHSATPSWPIASTRRRSAGSALTTESAPREPASWPATSAQSSSAPVQASRQEGVESTATSHTEPQDLENVIARKQSYLTEISQLEAKLQRVRRESQRLRAAQKAALDSVASIGMVRRDALEEFFLLCLHDLRREAARRGHAAAAAWQGRSREIHGGMRSRHQHESVATNSMVPTRNRLRNTRGSNMSYDQAAELCLVSDRWLNALFEKMFPHRANSLTTTAPGTPGWSQGP